MSLPLTNKAKLVNLYKKENDPKVKERLFLVIRVIEDGQVPFRVVREMNRSNPWASDWLKRYDREGMEGLRDRTRSGRTPEISQETPCQIKKELSGSNQGWTTKQVDDLIARKSGIKYHYTHTCRILRRWGFKQKVPRKVHVNTATREEKDDFKKGPPRCLWISSGNKTKEKRLYPGITG